MTRYDCQACGACCITPAIGDASYVDLMDEEAARIPKRLQARFTSAPVFGFPFPAMRTRSARALVVLDDGAPHTTVVTVCAALKGKAGKSCECTIYAERPRACVRFKPGSYECRVSRREIGLQ